MIPGSILGFSGEGFISGLINLATFGVPHRNLSHIGLVANHKGRLRLFESTIEDGVQAVPIEQRISRYVGKCWLFPLTRELFEHENDRLSDFLSGLIGTPYDLPGAVRAAGFLAAKLKAKSSSPDLSKLYCSELVAAAHNAIGIFPTPNPSRWSPNSVVRSERIAGVLANPTRLK